MRRLLKLFHTVSGAGFIGGIAVYLMLLAYSPDVANLEAFHQNRQNIALVSHWLILPSMGVILLSGLLSLAVHRPFQEMSWVWAKALSGILIFESTFITVDGAAQRAAQASAAAVAGKIDVSELAAKVYDHPGALYILLGLAIANIVLGIWRPRFKYRSGIMDRIRFKPDKSESDSRRYRQKSQS
jgi:hypothetical protein